MTLKIRKVIVIGTIAAILITANIMLIARWIDNMGIPDAARQIRQDFLTGTAITIIVVLLILLTGPASAAKRSCLVCQGQIDSWDKYCRHCGSRV